jgi:nitrite reductase/ring-hydroxylating ferredoxin subunit
VGAEHSTYSCRPFIVSNHFGYKAGKEAVMGKCAQCGNEYDKSFEVRMGGRTMIFDSFECAIQALAPVCPHCGCRIIGHGVEHGDTIFCCVHCAKQEGVKGLRDRD